MIIGIILVRNESERWLEQVLSQMRSVCDKLYALDDASTDDTPKICGKYCDAVAIGWKSLWGTNELIRRKQLWSIAESMANDGDWILCLDADETMPAIELLPELLTVVENTGCDCAAFRLYDMWSETHYRDDKWWIGHYGHWPFCVRYDANKEYVWNETPLHCGRFPKNSFEKMAQTEIAIQHWGWSRKNDRRVKYERYLKADPEGKWGFMGQYQSILDEAPNLRRFELA